MVMRVALLVGMTRVMPSFSSCSRRSVAIASISGMTRAGLSSLTTFSTASPSSMLMTCERWAICMAGA